MVAGKGRAGVVGVMATTQQGIASSRRSRSAGTGLDAIRDEMEALLARSSVEVRARAEAYWDRFESDPAPERLATWLAARRWREGEMAAIIGELLRRHPALLDRRDASALARQVLDEAIHRDTLGRLVDGLGGASFTPSPKALVWRDFLWDSLDRHPLGAVAAWMLSEIVAAAMVKDVINACRRHGYLQAVKALEEIAEEEVIHVETGRTLLERNARTDEDRAEIQRAMAGVAEIVIGSHPSVSPHE